LLCFENNDGVATIRLNDPERLNALTFQTYAELEKITAEMAHDPAVKVVVLTGTGKGFCSGGRVDDIIGPLLKMKGDELYQIHAHDLQRGQEHAQLKKPIIAAVNGIAAGAGAMLMLGSDLAPLLGQSAGGISLRKSRPVGRRYGRALFAAENRRPGQSHRAGLLRRHHRCPGSVSASAWPTGWCRATL
jgi:hypothetical protein